MRTQQLRSAFVLRATVADTETAELDAATPEQVDAAIAAPTEGTIAVNAETEQRGGGGRGRQGQGRQGGGGRRAPRVPIDSIRVGQELEGIVVRAVQDAPSPGLVARQYAGRQPHADRHRDSVDSLSLAQHLACLAVVPSAHAWLRCAAEKCCRLRLFRRHRLRKGRPRPHLAAVGELRARGRARCCVASRGAVVVCSPDKWLPDVLLPSMQKQQEELEGG